MKSEAKTVTQYLASLPPDRRKAMKAVRAVILKNLPKGYTEGMASGAIGYFVPHSLYPPGYHCDPTQPLPFAGLASQKNHVGIYLMCIYSDPKHDAWFRKAWAKTGKKLDMGKSCVRFKKLDDVALEVVGEAVRRVPVQKFIEFYESSIPASRRQAAKKTAKKRSTGKPAKKSARTSKKASAKKKVTTKKAPTRKSTGRTAGKTPAN